MTAWFSHIRYIVLGLFLASCLGAYAYQWWFIWPAQKCDRAAAWWDPEDHKCLDPIPVWRITGRKPPEGAGQETGADNGAPGHRFRR